LRKSDIFLAPRKTLEKLTCKDSTVKTVLLLWLLKGVS
jgi:hypothetical protein